MRLILYTGKGGVGKTTTAAATAVRSAAYGKRTLLVSVDPAHSLGDLLGQKIGAQPLSFAPNLDVWEVDATQEMLRHWGRIRDWLLSLFAEEGVEAVVAEELALLPGAEECAALLAVHEMSIEGHFDVVIVDCAPSDAALRLLRFPDATHHWVKILLRIQRAISAVLGPVARSVFRKRLPNAQVIRDFEDFFFQRLSALEARLRSGDTSVRLVMTPEVMAIAEARRTLADLQLFEIPCDAVVLNRMLPKEALEEPFFSNWETIQQERYEELEQSFSPIPVWCAPLQEDEVQGLPRLVQHSESLFSEIDPSLVYATAPKLRFCKKGSHYEVKIPMCGADTEEVDLYQLDQNLWVRNGSERRSIPLPQTLLGCELVRARYEDGTVIAELVQAGS